MDFEAQLRASDMTIDMITVPTGVRTRFASNPGVVKQILDVWYPNPAAPERTYYLLCGPKADINYRQYLFEGKYYTLMTMLKVPRNTHSHPGAVPKFSPSRCSMLPELITV